MQDEMIQRAAELLADGTVTRVLGWRSGQFVYDVSPALFETEDELQNFFVWRIYNVSATHRNDT